MTTRTHRDRPSRRESSGSWLGRAYDEDAKRDRDLALGELVGGPSQKRFVLLAERVASDTGIKVPARVIPLQNKNPALGVG